jgi:acyl dehydratase
MPPFEIEDLSALKKFEGKELPPTDWFVVTQDRIDKFADATADEQWIHVDPERAARESPYGGTIAHGFLTLSLSSHFCAQAVQVRAGVRMRINYGLNRVRFPAALLAGSAACARVKLLSVKESPEFVDVAYLVTVETREGKKPCCVAEWLVRYIRE